METLNKMLCSSVLCSQRTLLAGDSTCRGLCLSWDFACGRPLLVEAFVYGGPEEFAMSPLKKINFLRL